MKRLFIALLLQSSLVLAENPMRNMEEYRFVLLEEKNGVVLEQIQMYDEIDNYAITLTDSKDLAQFEFGCEYVPFFYPAELKDLGPKDWFDLNILLNSGAMSINHYTVQPSGILISKAYLTNHFSVLLGEVASGGQMTIILDNVPGKPSYEFEIRDITPLLKTFTTRCEDIYY